MRPEIQEQIQSMSASLHRPHVTERALRPVATITAITYGSFKSSW